MCREVCNSTNKFHSPDGDVDTIVLSTDATPTSYGNDTVEGREVLPLYTIVLYQKVFIPLIILTSCFLQWKGLKLTALDLPAATLSHICEQLGLVGTGNTTARLLNHFCSYKIEPSLLCTYFSPIRSELETLRPTIAKRQHFAFLADTSISVYDYLVSLESAEPIVLLLDCFPPILLRYYLRLR